MESSHVRRKQPAGGPRKGPGAVAMIESAKDAKSAFKRTVAYFGTQKYLLLLSAFVILIGVVLQVSGPAILGKAITNHLERHPDLTAFLRQVVILLCVFAGMWVAEVSGRLMLTKAANNIIFRLRNDAFGHLQDLSMSYYDKEDVGEVMSRLTNDVEAVEQGINMTFNEGLRGVLSVFLTLSAMIALNIRMTFMVIAMIPIMMILAAFVGIKVRNAFRVNQQKVADLTAKVEESVTGVKVIKTFGREQEEINEFNTVSIEARDAGSKAEMLSHLFNPLMQLVTSIILAMLVGIGGYLVFRNSVVYSVGLLASFIMYSRNFLMPIQQMTAIYNVIQSALAGAERIFEIIDTTPAIIEKETAIPFKDGDIRFDKVHFAYDPTKPVLEGIEFDVPQGSMIAIVGPTGAGKTTLINLLNRFYDVDQGAISINGTDIRDMTLGSLRSSVAVVLQEPFFFATTIRENLLYGNPDATEDDMIRAAETANAAHFISRLPHGYDTVLTEKGLNISQGERQLLAIARAILRNPSILILDEATSSIDSLIEKQIQQAVWKLMKDRTSFTIAHRLSTIINADRIIVIHDHKVIESGTYDELIAKNGFYAHLNAMQQTRGEVTVEMVKNELGE